MITDDILLENGYKRFNDNLYNAQSLFQKKIKDKKGIKYFIDIYKYTFKVKNYIPEYEIRLVSETDNYAINILLYATGNKMKIDEIEQEVERIWSALDLNYYEEE